MAYSEEPGMTLFLPCLLNCLLIRGGEYVPFIMFHYNISQPFPSISYVLNNSAKKSFRKNVDNVSIENYGPDYGIKSMMTPVGSKQC